MGLYNFRAMAMDASNHLPDARKGNNIPNLLPGQVLDLHAS